MWISGQWFGAETIKRITDSVKAEPSISRRSLSRQVCDWLDWRGSDGKLRDVSCRKALLRLQRDGHIQLPICEQVPGFNLPVPKKLEIPPIATISCSIAELGEIKVVPVSSRYSTSSSIWRGLMNEYHYLGGGPLCGAQIRYLIRSSNYGLLGGLSFSAATWRLKSRDTWIGWSESARRANLERVVCNSRFLIVPSVEVPNLASHVLSLSIGRLVTDWQERYGYQPVLLETFVDSARFTGTCYRAANWQHVGQTAGRSDGYGNGTISTGKKDIYLYPLARNYKSVLCHEPEDRLVLRTPSSGTYGWVEEEFGGARLYDERLRKRLYIIGNDFFSQPGELVLQACNGSEAKSKAAYRFFANEQVDMQSLLKGHLEATARRVSTHNVVLAVQDTTTLNYATHPSTTGLGPINQKKNKAQGLILHDTLAFSNDGTPLGILDAQCWARPPHKAGTKKDNKTIPIEEKESYKWLLSYRAVAEVQKLCPNTMLVSVGDREADIHELFQDAEQTESGPKLLVRSERSRKRKVLLEDEQAFLWEELSSEPVSGRLEILIPRNGSRDARIAQLDVRYKRVTLRPPRRKKLKPVEAWAVYATEVEYGPEVRSPLEWMLLTTVEVSSFEDAVERLRWYALRWSIEIYHRTLKSGCRIQDRQFNSADRIERCLAIDLVVAWRIYWLVKQGRETPDLPCDVFFEEEEWKILYAVVRNKPPPESPPTLQEAARMTAKLGGFLGRKADGEPGITTIWRGLVRLDNMMIGHRATALLRRQRDGP